MVGKLESTQQKLKRDKKITPLDKNQDKKTK